MANKTLAQIDWERSAVERAHVPPLIEATEAEQGLLSILMVYHELIDQGGACYTFEGLDVYRARPLRGYLLPTDFFSLRHRAIYQAMLEMSAAGLTFDYITLRDTLKLSGKLAEAGGPDYLAQLGTDVPDAHLYLPYAIAIIRHAAWRAEASLSAQIGPAILAGDNERVNAIQRELAMWHARINPEPQALDKPLLEQLLDWADDPREIRGFETGIAELDLAMGGLDNGELLVVLGYTGSGKSTLMMQFAFEFCRQGSGLIIPTEMTVPQWQRRMVAFELGVDEQMLRLGQFQDRKRLIEAVHRVENLPIRWFDYAAPTPEQIQACVQDAGPLCEWVIIDGLNDIIVPGADGHEKTSQAVSCLHRIARTGRIVAATAHMNRDSKQRGNKAPNPRDAFGSSRVEQLATRILTIWRPGYMFETGESDDLPRDKTGAPISPNLTYLKLAKSRFSQAGKTVPLMFHKHQGRLGFHPVETRYLDLSDFNEGLTDD